MAKEPQHTDKHSWGGGLVHYQGGCNDCDAEWFSRNVLGLAAQHAKKHRHNTWAETGHAYSFDGQTLPPPNGSDGGS